jgi:hypothetical protein
MAVSYVGKSTLVTGASVSVGVPSGYAEDDLLVLMAQGYEMPEHTVTGWTKLQYASSSNNNFQVLYKFAGESESSVSLSNTKGLRGVMLCFSGTHATTPINVSDTGTSEGTSFSSPTLTTTADNCIYVCAVGLYKASTASNDTTNYASWANASLASITEMLDQHTYYNTGTVEGGGGIAIAYGAKASAGEIGAATATADASSNNSAIIVFAISPLPAVNISVTSEVMTATAATPVPSISVTASVTITSEPMAATADVSEPTAGVSVSVEGEVMTASAETHEPSVSVIANIIIASEPMTATGEALEPVIGTSVSITAELMNASADIPAPSITAVVNVSIDIDILTATADLPVPLIKIVYPIRTVITSWAERLTESGIKQRATIAYFTERKTETGVTGMPIVGETIKLEAKFYNYSNALTDPDAVTVTIYNPIGRGVLKTGTAVKDATGEYSYDYTLPDVPKIVYEFKGDVEDMPSVVRDTVEIVWVGHR